MSTPTINLLNTAEDRATKNRTKLNKLLEAKNTQTPKQPTPVKPQIGNTIKTSRSKLDIALKIISWCKS